ncbi:MAG: uridine kinase [Alphaproteobacteria bacterium]|nr:uridine kinase [Alphaproteobacteria bacterium]
MQPDRPAPFVVLVAGGTASGKTTLVNRVAGRAADSLVLSHDRYYLDVVDPKRHNYDEPAALDTAQLVHDLERLRAGQPVALPRYDFATHSRLAEGELVQPAALIFVEGILVMADRRLRQLADLRVFVHAPADVRLARRLERDIVARGREPEGVLRQYLSTVRPGHRRHVEPSRFHADVVVDGEAPIDVMTAGLAAMIHARGGPL